MRVQKEISSTLLKTLGKVFLIWSGRNLSRMSSAAMWKAKLINDEIEYLAEEISKQRDGENSLVSFRCLQ